MPINLNYLKDVVFTENAQSRYIDAMAHYSTAMKLLECHKNTLHPRIMSQMYITLMEREHVILLYNFCLAIELMLKALFSAIRESNIDSPLSSPESYSHNVKKMLKDLFNAGLIADDISEIHEVNLINVYLAWFGRYYSPNENSIDNTIKNAFTIPDENKMVEFKYKPQKDTADKLIRLFNEIDLKIPEQKLTLSGLTHSLG